MCSIIRLLDVLVKICLNLLRWMVSSVGGWFV